MFSGYNMGIELEAKTKTMMHKERRDLWKVEHKNSG